MTNHQPKAAELAYRKTDVPFPTEGDIRGNPKVKDGYFITSLNLLIRLSRER